MIFVFIGMNTWSFFLPIHNRIERKTSGKSNNLLFHDTNFVWFVLGNILLQKREWDTAQIN